MENKILLYSVVVNDEHIVAEARLVTIQQMLIALEADPPKTVDELVKRYGADRFAESYNPKGRELIEAVFDQKTGDQRSDRLCEISNDKKGIVSTCSNLGSVLIDALLKQLPETAPYASELVDV